MSKHGSGEEEPSVWREPVTPTERLDTEAGHGWSGRDGADRVVTTVSCGFLK